MELTDTGGSTYCAVVTNAAGRSIFIEPEGSEYAFSVWEDGDIEIAQGSAGSVVILLHVIQNHLS
jgi:hypothetical protein